MRGSPLARALIVFALLLCVAPAIWELTHAEAAHLPPAPKIAETETKELQLELAFTVPPARVAILHLGKQVWEKASPEAREEATISVSWPKEGGELKFTIDWPEGSPLAAMRVKLTDPERGEIERSLWGRGPKSGVLGFP